MIIKHEKIQKNIIFEIQNSKSKPEIWNQKSKNETSNPIPETKRKKLKFIFNYVK